MKMIKTATLKWLGRIARIEDNVPCMNIKLSHPEGSRKKGRSRTRWFDSVSKEIKTLGVNTWWKKQEIGMRGV
jgi:hypothetical protein